MPRRSSSLPGVSDPPRQKPWWVDTLLLIGCIAVAELFLHNAIELADFDVADWALGLIDAAALSLMIGPLFGWMMYRRHVGSRIALERIDHSTRVPNSPHKRVRIAVLGSMAVIAALVAASLWGNVATTSHMARSAEVVNLAGRQRMLTERVARFSANAIVDPVAADSMRTAARRMQTDAQTIEQVTAAYDVRAFKAARDARDAFIASGTSRDSLIASAAAMTQFAIGSERRRLAAVVVLRQAELMRVKAEATVMALQRYSEERVRRSARSSWLIAVMVQVVIALIALLVIEPVVRLLKQQHQIAAARSVEFQHLAMVAKRTSNAVVITDAERRVTWVNDGFTRLTGYSLEEVLGKSPSTLLHCEHTDPVTVETLRVALGNSASVRCEILNRAKDGGDYWLDLSIEPLHDRGQLTGFISIQTDITDQVRTREALKEQSQIASAAYLELQRATQLLEQAQTVARLGSWCFDLGPGQIEWTRETYLLYGRDPQAGVPTYEEFMTYLIPADAVRLNEAVQSAAGTGVPYAMVIKTARGANGVRHVRVEGRAVRDDAGNVIRLFGTAMDVTAAIEREEALLQAQQRAEAASQSKSEFLANMSHEIRTPLTAILGYTDLLRDEAIRQGAPDEQLHSMGTIRRAGEHLLAVLNDILDLSKIEAGRMAIERIETDLPRVLFDVDSLMRSRAAQKGVQLQTRLLSPIPERVFSDPTRLRQILMNLVGNAAKFTSRGLIDIQVDLTTLHGAPAVRIAVVDTGPGMTPEQASTLFQPFVQADTSVTRKHGGTGLGLTICRRLASLMGGEVQLVRTTLGAGSTFALTLPLQAVDGARNVNDLQACVNTPSALKETGAYAVALHGRILLAEDGEDNQRLISHHLRKAGAHVVVAEHGRRALELILEADAAGAPFGLLVTDMQMPEMDGYTLARTLRAQQHPIPIVALTAHAMAEDRQRCLDAGCDDYASKPVDRGALIATCARWMQMMADDCAADAVLDVFPQPALYSELHNDPELAELIVAFTAGLPAKITRIEHAHASGALPDLARLAHQLKGAAGGYGYPSISSAARDVEQHSNARVTANGTFDPGVNLTEAVTQLLDRCRLAVRTLEHST